MLHRLGLDDLGTFGDSTGELLLSTSDGSTVNRGSR
jgi:hypothetical protein